MLQSAIFFIAFLIRLILIPLPGFKADIAYWKWWGMSAAHDGLSGPLINTAYNYPSFYLYILKATSHLYEFITGFNFKLNPHDAVFWSDSNFLYLFLIKTPYLLADLGIGFLIYKIVRSVIARIKSGLGMTIGLVAASLYLFNPVVIYNSSIWGQTDSLGSLFVLLAFYFLLTSHYSLLAIFAAISLFMKTQTLVLLPILFLGIYLYPRPSLFRSDLNTEAGKVGPLQTLIKSLWVFIATVIIINLPFLTTHTMDRVFDIMYNSQAYFPYVSMNAYNLWWLFFGRASSSFWDQNLIVNLISFKAAGFILFGTIYGLAIRLLIKADDNVSFVRGFFSLFSKKTPPAKRALAGPAKSGGTLPTTGPVSWTEPILQALILISFAFFMLLTQMHERYLFPLFAFFPILLGLNFSQNSLRSPKFLTLLTIYLTLTTTTLINLHQVMIMNYPDNTLSFLPNTFNEPLTRFIAFINLIILIILLLVFVRPILFKKTVLTFLAMIYLIVPAGAYTFKIYFNSKGEISLTDMKPKIVSQGYGQLGINRNLSNNWQSVVYYFFKHGLSTHANSRLVYNLEGKYKIFSTNFGVDTDATDNASVRFIIKGDGRELFKSPIITRYFLPGFAKVNVAEVKELELIVDDAGDGVTSDHADWLEPKLYR